MEPIRYSAAACQTALANPVDRQMMKRNTDRMLSMIDSAVAGSAPFLPVRLIVFPEFAHSAPVFATASELVDKLAVEIPNASQAKLKNMVSTSKRVRCWRPIRDGKARCSIRRV